ncbi:MAG: hypothetical protein Kow0069_01220 [Promethearchaeota archaeon]
MPHFIVELIQKPDSANPAEEMPEVHRHFARYSRGSFSGPALKVSRTTKYITLEGSFEYENALQRLAVETLPDGHYSVTGSLMASWAFDDLLADLEIQAEVKAPSKKAKKKVFKATLSSMEAGKDTILSLLEELGTKGFVFLSFSAPEVGVMVTTKKQPPRPNQKNPSESLIKSSAKFCRVKLPNDPETFKRLVDELFPDFEGVIPGRFKTLRLENTYKFDALELPKEKVPSRELRVKTTRIGKITRKLTVVVGPNKEETHEKSHAVRA